MKTIFIFPIIGSAHHLREEEQRGVVHVVRQSAVSGDVVLLRANHREYAVIFAALDSIDCTLIVIQKVLAHFLVLSDSCLSLGGGKESAQQHQRPQHSATERRLSSKKWSHNGMFWAV